MIGCSVPGSTSALPGAARSQGSDFMSSSTARPRLGGDVGSRAPRHLLSTLCAQGTALLTLAGILVWTELRPAKGRVQACWGGWCAPSASGVLCMLCAACTGRACCTTLVMLWYLDCHA